MTNLVKVTTYQRISAMVNPYNPAFDFHTGYSNEYVYVHAIIGDGKKQWREQFKVSSKEVAEEQIKETIKFFNDTRYPEPPMEAERFFVELYVEDKAVARYCDDTGMSGWLDPEGIFHPCGFGEHVQYALELLNQDDRKPWKSATPEEIKAIKENQHIPMSNHEDSSGGFIGILGEITPPQVVWFNRFFFKLSPSQRSVVALAAQEQGIQLKYEW